MPAQHLLFTFWLIPLIAAVTYLGGLHQPLFSAPQSKTTLASSHREFTQKGPRVAHVLSEKCGCSGRVANHLESREALSGAQEIIFQVDQRLSNAEQLEKKGFKLLIISSEELSNQWGIDALPLMQAQVGDLSYSGGYQSYKSETYQDAFIIQNLKNNFELPEIFNSTGLLAYK